MVLAAGLGARMRHLTVDRPKALIEVCETPLIDGVLDRLGAAGVSRAVVNVHHHASILREVCYVGDQYVVMVISILIAFSR